MYDKAINPNNITAIKHTPSSSASMVSKAGSDFKALFQKSLPSHSHHSSETVSGQKNDHTYTVKQGDCLSVIVHSYLKSTKTKGDVNSLVHKVARDNGISNPDLIMSGQKLNISSLADAAYRQNSQESTKISQMEKVSPLALKSAHIKSSSNIINVIERVAASNGIDPHLGIAVARAESGINSVRDSNIVLNPGAVNQTSQAKGLFQLKDVTGKRFHKMLDMKGGYNPFNVSQNVHIGISYLKYLDHAFSKETVLSEKLNTVPVPSEAERKLFYIAAFNSGEGRVATAQKKAIKAGKDPGLFKNIENYLPAETRDYVQKVLKFEDMLA